MGTWTQQTRESDGKVYLSVTDTAKLVRGVLKRAFPGRKFSVRSSSYSMGASIRVAWVDGPMKQEVEDAVGMFHGASFDGMIDLKYHLQHWLMPDGTVTYAKTGGGGSTNTEQVYDPPDPNARLCSLGADYIFCEREASPERHAECRRELEEFTGTKLPDDERDWWRIELPVKVWGAAPGTRHDDRYPTGTLVRFVETETESASTLVRQLHDTRSY